MNFKYIHTEPSSFVFPEQRLQLLPALGVIAVHVVRKLVVAPSFHDSGHATHRLPAVWVQAVRGDLAHQLSSLNVHS